MSRSGWIVATSIGAVEALKDQLGVCRWNYGLRSLQQRAKTSVQSLYHTQTQNSSSSSSSASDDHHELKMREREKKRELGLKKVVELSSWGPTTVRF